MGYKRGSSGSSNCRKKGNILKRWVINTVEWKTTYYEVP
jgi:hypothetical protein